MAENLLKDLEINEDILEGALYSIGEDNDWDLVGRQLHGAKNLASGFIQTHFIKNSIYKKKGLKANISLLTSWSQIVIKLG